jgi:hypothetical protein
MDLIENTDLIKNMELKLLIELLGEFKKILLAHAYKINLNAALKVLGGIDKLNNIEEYENINFSSNNDVLINLLFKKSKLIKLLYPYLNTTESFVIVIYTYYILNLIEDLSFPFYIIKKLINSYNQEKIINIINDITMFDIMHNDVNISSNIRRSFLFGNIN